MKTLSNGNIFRVTGHLCGEFTGPGEFPAQRPVMRSFDVFFDLCPNNGWVNKRDVGDLRCYRAHYDVIVMLLIRFRPIKIRYTSSGFLPTLFVSQAIAIMPPTELGNHIWME